MVVLPFYSGDVWLLEKNLVWMQELDGKLDFDCLLACDTETEPAKVLALAKQIFKSVDVIRYKRARIDRWPFQQNNAFMHVSWAMAAKNRPWFWCETDCTPLKLNWLSTLWREYQKGQKPFGGHWNPATDVFNGVAIYPAHISRYSRKMAMAALTTGVDAKGQPAQSPWDAHGSAEVYKHLHVMNPVMQHVWDIDGDCATFENQEEVDRIVRPEVVLFHRCKDGSLVDRMRERHRGQAAATGTQPIVSFNDVHVSTEPKTSIFIVTYHKDAEFLKACLASIHKYALRPKSFQGVVVAMPKQDSHVISPICKEYGVRRILFPEDRQRGHLHQEAMKCKADEFCPDSDFILHLDSDCVFTEYCSPADYFENGKPVLLFEDYDRLQPKDKEATAGLWQKPTEWTLGFPIKYEFMRRLPLVYPRALYAAFRAHIEKRHSKPFVQWVLSQKADFPYGFCEFNSMGAYAWEFMRDSFHWLDVATLEVKPENALTQLWSHGGMDFVHPEHGKQSEFIAEALA